MSRLLKSLGTATILSILLLAAVAPAHAFEGREGDRVVIEADEVVNDDLYVGADEFIMDGTINGDLVSGGQMLTINGTVNGNLIAAGQTIVVNGDVAGDVLAAGSVLLFGEEATVGGDVIAGGYSLEFEEGSTIGRDALVAGGQVLLAADVTRNVKAATGALEIAGTVGGDVQAAVGESSEVQAGPPPTVFMPRSSVAVPIVRQGLTIDEDAKIEGDLQYTQISELSFPAGVVAGTITRVDPPETDHEATPAPTAGERAGQWGLQSLRSLVTLILIGLLLLWLVPSFMRGLVSELRDRLWPSLGWGVVSYAAFFFVILLTVFVMILGGVVFGLLTLEGLSATIVWVGLLVLFALILTFVLATAFVAKIVFGATLGQWMLRKLNSPLAEHRYWPMILGVAITALVIALLTFPAIPGFLGWLLNLVIILFGLGSMWLWLRPRLLKRAPALA